MIGFDWSDYLELAERMSECSQLPEEAMQRSAVSRAYYAAFHVVMDRASRDYGFMRTRTSEDHVELRNHLKKKALGDVANALSRLHVWRKNCDYDDLIGDLHMIHENALRSARKLMDRL